VSAPGAAAAGPGSTTWSLTAATAAWLAGSQWADRSDVADAVEVPGAFVNGPWTAGNLLNVAIWNLVHHDRVAVERLRPYAAERAGGFSGGWPFTRLSVIDADVRLPGLEGVVLRALRAARTDDERGTRRVVLAMRNNHRRPWSSVVGHCLGEAVGLGIVGVEGRLRRRVVVRDDEALRAAWRAYDGVCRLRADYRADHRELDDAVLADCVHGLYAAYESGSGAD